ncbi:amino acid adenylation domain-containing protein [Streptomyces sp. H39-S7]|uniref:amino acid adenylation domain-containing protein n=1 Tax=Streptomyces sp. H39-S7 TaxID=3004357 RepID=UPI0022B04316|nr:amino acid adenylation domain-containing protein [Streptomyces sp. H39-S7]MCZ4119465.1 amino acid adenylation domain-containing protein [Streptomyces sp. H39-S7]
MPTPDTRSAPGGRRALLTGQEGIWTGHQLDGESPAYNTAEYVQIHGPVDVAAFDKALHHVVGEVEALNVRFTEVDGRPWEIAVPAVDWRLHTADLTAEPDPRAAAADWMRHDLARPVDLAHDPVFGHALLQTGPAEFLWYHRVHHIALDGFGLSLVARRVAQVYTALAEGTPLGESGFGTLESVFEEDRAYLASKRRETDGAYWTGRFADRPTVPSLADRSALPARTFLRRMTDLGAPETETLRAVARELSVTWSDVVLAVTAGYLGQVSGEPEVVLSLPVMGRLGSVSLRVPCMVRNVLPLRIAVGPGDTLRELATRVSAELRAGLPHQRYRYEHLRRELRLVGGRRRLSGPGVNIMPFEYDLRFAGHRSTVHNVSAGPVDDLSVNVYDRAEGEGLRFAFDAHPELYDEAALARHQHAVLALLNDATAAPDRPLGELGTRPAAPRPARTAVTLDGGPLPRPARSVVDLITAHAATRGDATAVAFDGATLSYAELLAAAGGVAGRLAGHGTGPGDTVIVALPRGTEAVAAILGVLLAGAAYCPVDPGAPAARIDTLCAESGAGAVITTAGYTERFAGSGLPRLLLEGGKSLDVVGPPPSPAEPDPDRLAYVIHTSGSTGRPKGVEISHAALAHFVAGASDRYGIGPDDRVLQFAPLHFDASVEEIFLTLCAGAALVVRTDAMTESVPVLLRSCERLGITVLDLPTAYWHELAYAVSTGAAALPPKLRTVIIGGEAALPERVDRWRDAVGTSVRLFNTYGPTEATVVATTAELQVPELARGDVPIGRPLAGTRAVVVTPSADDAGADSAVGELYLVGDALARGYRGGAGGDSARFQPLPELADRPRAYRTGDLVRLGADGQLRFVGRADAEFKISGHRVQPAEVETVLLTHDAIREAAVVGQVLADGTRRLVAHVVADPPAPSAAEVREHLRATLPAAMIPSAVVLTGRLPRTSAGKIDRNALAAPAVAAPPVPSDEEAAGGDNRTEQVVIAAWARILGTADINPQDDFFDLGAQSLQAIQVANRLGVELETDVRVAWLFQYPTAAELARHLDDQHGPAVPGAVHRGAVPDAVLADAVLDDDITVRPPGRTAPASPPRRVLLTGATGFVGAHLLTELLTATDAEVVCLVRAEDRAAAEGRIQRALAAQELTLPPGSEHRVVAEPGDLARPLLGLTEGRYAELASGCDAIYHNAATVSIMREYASLRGPNVESTRQLLRMAAARSLPFHLVSTLSVAPPAGASPEVAETFLPPHPGLAYGYQQSKWAAERLVEQAAERGLPVTVHRLGRVVGAAGTGYVNERDFLWSVLRAGIPAGIVPDLFEAEVWTPVDYVAQAVVRLSAEVTAAAPAERPVYNHAPVPTVRLADLYAWIREFGYPVECMPLARWRAELPRAADVATTTLAFFDTWTGDDSVADETAGGAVAEPVLGLGRVVADNLLRGLDGSGISCPPVDRELVFRYLERCVATGALPPPARRGPRVPRQARR